MTQYSSRSHRFCALQRLRLLCHSLQQLLRAGLPQAQDLLQGTGHVLQARHALLEALDRLRVKGCQSRWKEDNPQSLAWLFFDACQKIVGTSTRRSEYQQNVGANMGSAHCPAADLRRVLRLRGPSVRQGLVALDLIMRHLRQINGLHQLVLERINLQQAILIHLSSQEAIRSNNGCAVVLLHPSPCLNHLAGSTFFRLSIQLKHPIAVWKKRAL